MIYAIGAIVLLIVVGVWVLGRKLRKAGQDEVRANVATVTADVQRRMDKAGAEGPRTEADVVDRLRRGDF